MDKYIEQNNEYQTLLNDINYYIKSEKVLLYLISGPPGIGKSFMAEEIAKELNVKHETLSGHPGLTREDIEGVPFIVNGTSGFKDGVVPRMINAANKEGIAMLIIDEFNLIRTEIQPSFNSLFDYRGAFSLTTDANREYSINKDCTLIVIATINENIEGVMPLQQSTLSRFSYKFNLNHPDIKTEAKILNMKTKIDFSFATEICKFARELRNAAIIENTLERAVSPRELITFCRSLRVPGVEQKDSFLCCITNKLIQDETEKNLIEDMLNGFGLFSKINNVTFEDQKKTTTQTTKTTTNFILTVKPFTRYSINQLPKEILYKDTHYKIIPKGKRVPLDIWVGKIVTKENRLELHYKTIDGNKKVVNTGVRFNFI